MSRIREGFDSVSEDIGSRSALRRRENAISLRFRRKIEPGAQDLLALFSH